MNRRGDGSIDPEKLKALFRAGLHARDEAGEINDEFAKDKKAAVKELRLHSRAFTLCLSIRRMEQAKRIGLLKAFDNYREILELDDEPQGELEDAIKDATGKMKSAGIRMVVP